MATHKKEGILQIQRSYVKNEGSKFYIVPLSQETALETWAPKTGFVN